MARSILSFDMFSVRAARMAARSRAFIPGSGDPILPETVISRASLPNSLALTASCRPLRCMMFLNCECPAMASSLLPKSRSRLLEPAAEAHAGDAPGEAGRIVGLHRDRAQGRFPERRLEAAHGDAAQKPVERLLLGHAHYGIRIAG